MRRSISAADSLYWSLWTKICLIVTMSRNCLPSWPLVPISSLSCSAAACSLDRASRIASAGFVRGLGPRRVDALSCCENADEGDCVGFGWTGPMLRSESAKSGSDASRSIATFRVELACGCDCATSRFALRDGCGKGLGSAFAPAGFVPGIVGFVGNFLAAAPAAFDDEDPITVVNKDDGHAQMRQCRMCGRGRAANLMEREAVDDLMIRDTVAHVVQA